MLDSIYANSVSIVQKKLSSSCELTKEQNESLRYVLEVIIGELFKTIGLLVIFIIIDEVVYYLYTLITLLSIRPFSGGMHFKTFSGCTIFTAAFFLISLFISKRLSINYITAVLIFVLSFLIIWMFAPITSSSRPKYGEHKQKTFRNKCLISIFIHCILYFGVNNYPYLQNAIWVILLNSIQLLIAKGGEIYEKK